MNTKKVQVKARCDMLTIDSIEKLGDKSGKYLVRFDDEETEMVLTSTQIADLAIFPGMEFTHEEFIELTREIEQNASKARALKTIGSRTLSSKEIQKRMVAKGDSAEIASQTTQWLEEIGLVNDEEYAKSIVRHYTKKGYGNARIKQELFKRGIERDFWDDAMEESDGMEDAAYAFVEKKLRSGSDESEIRKTIDAMRRRGYSYDEARAAINRYLEENPQD